MIKKFQQKKFFNSSYSWFILCKNSYCFRLCVFVRKVVNTFLVECLVHPGIDRLSQFQSHWWFLAFESFVSNCVTATTDSLVFNTMINKCRYCCCSRRLYGCPIKAMRLVYGLYEQRKSQTTNVTRAKYLTRWL